MPFRPSVTLLAGMVALASLAACASTGSSGGAPTMSAEGGGTDAGSGGEGSAASPERSAETGASDASVSHSDSGVPRDASDESPGDSEAGDSATRACDMVQCIRAIRCVTSCGGPATYIGCCSCSAPAFDDIACADAAPVGDGGVFGCTADPSGNAMCGAGKPPHFYRCMFPYQQPAGCQVISIGNVTDTYCCP